MPSSHFVGKNIWILKPTGLNRGKGIHVVDNMKEIKRLIKQHCAENAKAAGVTQTPGNYNASAKFADAIG